MNEIERNKALIERYPFLLPRNVWTDKVPEDYDYSYIRGTEIPEGWQLLFLQACEDIRQPLIDANYLDKFRFTQIKEKYNRLCLYHCGAPEAVDKILLKYEVMARYVCTRCGKPADVETQGYIASYCDDCWDKIKFFDSTKPIEKKLSYTLTRFSKDASSCKEIISFEDEWNRYVKMWEETYEKE